MNGKFGNERLQYVKNAAKLSAKPRKKIDENKYFRSEEIFSSNQRQIIEVMFAYSLSGKVFGKNKQKNRVVF